MGPRKGVNFLAVDRIRNFECSPRTELEVRWVKRRCHRAADQRPPAAPLRRRACTLPDPSGNEVLRRFPDFECRTEPDSPRCAVRVKGQHRHGIASVKMPNFVGLQTMQGRKISRSEKRVDGTADRTRAGMKSAGKNARREPQRMQPRLPKEAAFLGERLQPKLPNDVRRGHRSEVRQAARKGRSRNRCIKKPRLRGNAVSPIEHQYR